MRKFTLALTVVFTSFFASGQSSDPDLNKRLDEYMRLTRELKFEEVMNYMHPKIFDLATKEQLIEVFKQTFESEEISMSFDSTSITGVSDDFVHEKVIYKKIDYLVDMAVLFKDTASLRDENFIAIMKNAFLAAFPGGTVVYNPVRKSFEIKAPNIMFALKDNALAPWLFLGYEKKNEALGQLLYPKEVLGHFKLSVK